MRINTPVRFITSGHSTELSAAQAKAVGDGIGVVTALETRDGVGHADVLFAVYGGLFAGIPVADLEPLDKPAPRTLAGKLGALFTRG
jgi:hypothetical protein